MNEIISGPYAALTLCTLNSVDLFFFHTIFAIKEKNAKNEKQILKKSNSDLKGVLSCSLIII